MENLGWFDFKAEGLSLERLLNECVKRGVRLRGVRKVSPRAIKGSVAASDLPRLEALAQARGWRLTVTGSRGPVRLSRLARRRALLVAGGLAFLFLCWSAMSCVWFIDVRGAGPYTGEVERVLREHEARVGRFAFLIDTDAIEADLERQLTGLSWVGVTVRGVRLTVSCVQAQLAKNAGTAVCDLVAARDGIIDAITVSAGTPAVKPGDAVREGQVLVRGEERAWNGATVPIRAEGSVTARVWYTAEAYVSGTLVETVPTGAAHTRRILCVPRFEYALDGMPDYGDYDRVDRVLAIGGSFPVWLRLERYLEVVRGPVVRDQEDVRAEAGLAATRQAQEKAGGAGSVIDKWVEYSMIQDGGCFATAVVEVVTEIAQPGPERVSEDSGRAQGAMQDGRNAIGAKADATVRGIHGAVYFSLWR